MRISSSPSSSRLILIWLLGTCFLIWLMIMLGGATRLTHSGLSIVEWKPIVGIIPPLSENAWMMEFEKYKQFPEYKLINFTMDLEGFKFIFLMEYTHRLLGRLIGFFFFIPLIYFWAKGLLTSSLKKKMVLILLIGAAQGVMGWYMVKSGLVKDPAVSAYRLTAHLLLALLLFALLFWTACQVYYQHQQDRFLTYTSPSQQKNIFLLIHLSAIAVLITITYGGFVAGLKAGKMYNTYPLMNGQFIPSEWDFMKPLIRNFFENPATVQWMHRTLAIFTLILTGITLMKIFHIGSSYMKKVCVITLGALMTQVLLGITTLLLEVPVSLGTLHQGMGVVVFMLILYLFFMVKRNPINFETTP